MSPLASKVHFDRVSDHLECGKLQGQRSARAQSDKTGRIAIFFQAIGVEPVCDGRNCRNWTEVLSNMNPYPLSLGAKYDWRGGN